MEKAHFFYLIIGALAALLFHLMYEALFPSYKSVVSSPQGSYDYIIVGGGTSGCVLANRLSRSRKNKVLLIEAGGLPPFLSTIPLAAPLLQGGSADWSYSTVPQRQSSEALKNFISKWPRGKTLGGTGQINFHINMLSIEEDLDRWSNEWDLPTWNRSIVDKYVDRMYCKKRVLTETGMNATFGIETRCSEPRLRITQPSAKIGSIFRDAGLEKGIPLATEEHKYGVYSPEGNIFEGKRWSTFDGYLKPAMDRENLHVLLHSHTTQVLFSGNRAIGVEYMDSEGKTAEVYVRDNGEVLLSSGAVNSPQILMLSGIGPREHLSGLSIPVISDLPVGQNLQDHLVVPIRVTINKTLSINAAKVKSLSTFGKYFLLKKGPLSKSGVEGTIVMPLGSWKKDAQERMSLMSVLFNMGSIDTKAYTEAANIPIEAYRQWFPGADNENAEGFIFLSICLNCQSMGSIRLNGTDPRTPPLIDPNYLSDEDDVRCLIEAVRLSASLVDTKAFKAVGAEMQLPKFPECGHPDVSSDSYLECVVRKAAITMYHPVGTAYMGRDGVLDDKLRVKNVNGLRVIDASSFPTLPSGTPNSAIIFLAERASDIILDDRRNRRRRKVQPIRYGHETRNRQNYSHTISAVSPAVKKRNGKVQ